MHMPPLINVLIFVAGVAVGLVFAPSPYLELSSSDTVVSSIRSNRKTQTEQQQEEEKRKSFTEILIESGSDKYERHHYERYYEPWLQPYRSKQNLKFLEIGANTGSSLRLWDEYFDNSPELIIGLAYDNAGQHHTQNLESNIEGTKHVQLYWGDQSKKETTDALAGMGPYDVIIDDGSHVPQHVIFSFFSLWNSVKPGGLYVIEDLETNYWPHGSNLYGYTLNHTGIGAGPQHSVISKIEQIQQVLVRHQIGAEELSVMENDHDICSVEWGMNLVAIKKCLPTTPTSSKAPYQTKIYDAMKMKEWIQTAKETNPF